MNIKEGWKKFWYLLWKDNTWKGWLFSIVVLFIFIKFIFFPVLSLVTGTVLPLAIVESCSMYHDGNLLSDYDQWWENHEEKYSEFNLDKSTFKDFIFKNGFNKGDILFIIGKKPEKIDIGDIIIFNAGKQNPIIHRVINIRNSEQGFVFETVGDNNNGQLNFEKNISEDLIIGKAVFKLAPYLGWGKLVFFEGRKPSSERGFCSEN